MNAHVSPDSAAAVGPGQDPYTALSKLEGEVKSELGWDGNSAPASEEENKEGGWKRGDPTRDPHLSDLGPSDVEKEGSGDGGPARAMEPRRLR